MSRPLRAAAAVLLWAAAFIGTHEYAHCALAWARAGPRICLVLFEPPLNGAQSRSALYGPWDHYLIYPAQFIALLVLFWLAWPRRSKRS